MNDPRATSQTEPVLAPKDTAAAPAGARIRMASVAPALQAQLFAAFHAPELEQHDLAATLLRLAQPTPSPLAAGPSAGASVKSIDALARELAGQGGADHAEQLVRQAVDQEICRTGIHSEQAVALQIALAELLQQQGKVGEARRLLAKSVELQRERLGPQHPEALDTLEKLAVLLVQAGDLTYAEPLLCEAVLVRRRAQGDGHPDTLRALSSLSLLLLRQGKASEAEPLLRQCLQLQRRTLGPAAADTRVTLRYLAEAALALGNIADAEALLGRVVVLTNQAMGQQHVESLQARFALITFWMNQGRFAESRHRLVELLSQVKRSCSPRSPLRLEVQAHFGTCLRALGDYAGAELHLNESFERSRAAFGMAHVDTQYALGELIALYDAWGKPKEAAPFREAASACS